jgi:hypothetical protein
LSFLIYITVKFVAYAARCIAGVRLLRAGGSRLRTSLLFGFIRLLIGACLGVAVFLVGGMMHLQTPANPLLMYFAVYAPIRLVEWSIMAYLIADGSRAIHSAKLCTWTLGGIAVSHLADIPLFLLLHGGPGEMLPVGRFLC